MVIKNSKKSQDNGVPPDTELELHMAWPAYIPGESSGADILRIVGLVNDKFRERLPAWQIIAQQPQHFGHFFTQILHMALDETLPFAPQTELVTFLANCFNSLEVEMVCEEAGRLCAMPIWVNLLQVIILKLKFYI